MRSIKIIFGTHNGQPVGNFDFVNEKVYQNAYKPFLRMLYNYPDFPVTLHYSGVLLEWIEEHHPEFLMLLDEMVKRKQVELLGGGYYEPILSIIPNSDKLGQIESLTTYIRSHFGRRPRGSWITERVWEPYLASILKNSGMEYIFLDDIHLKTAGLNDDQLFYPYLTEDQGKVVAVYPISRPLRAMIPEKNPENIIDFLRENADESDERIVSIMDNGEKYGDWEGSYARMYQEQWLERFIKLILENKTWIEPVHPGRYLKKSGCRGKIYIGCMLYEEMFNWLHAKPPGSSINADPVNSVQLGSSFRKFLCKYPESNFLYSKMIYISILVNQIRGDKYKKRAAKEELWRGQSNTVYWHGNFDGLYSNHLRKKVYRALLEAEKLTRVDGVFLPSIISTDFDTDGRTEFLFQGNKLNAYIHTLGGMLFELDFLPISWNYLDTMNRYREPYHDNIAKYNNYDWYLRKAFLDHFFDKSVDIDSFKSMHYHENGDFLTGYYNLKNLEKDNFQVTMQRDGFVMHAGKPQSVRVCKQFQFTETKITVRYNLVNLSQDSITSCFAVENNFALAPSGSENWNVLSVKDYNVGLNNDTFQENGLKIIKIKDLKNNVLITLTADRKAGLWNFPIETFSRTLNQLNKVYQSSCFLLYWELEMEPGAEWAVEIVLSLSCKLDTE